MKVCYQEQQTIYPKKKKERLLLIKRMKKNSTGIKKKKSAGFQTGTYWRIATVYQSANRLRHRLTEAY